MFMSADNNVGFSLLIGHGIHSEIKISFATFIGDIK